MVSVVLQTITDCCIFLLRLIDNIRFSEVRQPQQWGAYQRFNTLIIQRVMKIAVVFGDLRSRYAVNPLSALRAALSDWSLLAGVKPSTPDAIPFRDGLYGMKLGELFSLLRLSRQITDSRVYLRTIEVFLINGVCKEKCRLRRSRYTGK